MVGGQVNPIISIVINNNNNNNDNNNCVRGSRTQPPNLCWVFCAIKGTVTRFCARAATWFLFWRTVFQDWRLVKKSSSIDPETPERAIISVFKSYLVHLGSFKRHILYFCASIVEKIRSHWGEPYEAKFVVVSVPTNGSNVAFNVVIWLSFLSIKVLQSTIYLWRIFFKRWICKESSRGFPRFSRGLLMARSGEWSLACEQALHLEKSRVHA